MQSCRKRTVTRNDERLIRRLTPQDLECRLGRDLLQALVKILVLQPKITERARHG